MAGAPGKELCRDIVEKLAPDFLLPGANFLCRIVSFLAI